MLLHTCCGLFCCKSWFVSQTDCRQNASVLLFALAVTAKCTQPNDKVCLICAHIYSLANSLCWHWQSVISWNSSVRTKMFVFGWFSSLSEISAVRGAGKGGVKGACHGMSHWTGLAAMSACSRYWFFSLIWGALPGKLNLYCSVVWHSSNYADCILLDITDFSCTWLEH